MMIGTILCAVGHHKWPAKHRVGLDNVFTSQAYPVWTPSSCGWHEHRYCERCHEMQIRYKTDFPHGAPGIVHRDPPLP